VSDPGSEPYAALLVAVLRQAVQDGRRGQREALAFLRSADCAAWFELLGLEPAALQRQMDWEDPAQPGGEWLDVEQASRLTGYNREYLRRLARQGRLAACRQGNTLRLSWASLKWHREGVRSKE
jgi:excisionase family DNA binding protein